MIKNYYVKTMNVCVCVCVLNAQSAIGKAETVHCRKRHKCICIYRIIAKKCWQS